MILGFGNWVLKFLAILCGWWGVDDDWDFRVSGLSAVRVFWESTAVIGFVVGGHCGMVAGAA